MANYSSAEMNVGVLGEALTANTNYQFIFTTPPYPGRAIANNQAYFVMDSSTTANLSLQGSSTNRKIGSLWANYRLPFSSPNVTTTVNDTFTFDVVGNTRGSGATITLTSTAGVITEGFVTSQTGGDYIDNDSITISQNDLQAAGFANANRSAIMDLFPDEIDGIYQSSDLSGVFGPFAGDVLKQNFVGLGTSENLKYKIAFNMLQGLEQGSGQFQYNPTINIPASSYLLKSTGHFDLQIQ
jgi:hypothetical protein|tara:strand:- start:11483 stop:12205 length:723 start_codon:yes stop_codon:yes gene_type:complete